jgi:hypothetical protein
MGGLSRLPSDPSIGEGIGTRWREPVDALSYEVRRLTDGPGDELHKKGVLVRRAVG